MGTIVSCRQFANFLDTQSPFYDKLIIRDIRPEDSLIGEVETGAFDAYTETTHTRDRFKSVFPNLTKRWVNRGPAVNFPNSCLTTPCDPKEYRIGWGYDRITYGLQQASWQTDLICFDQTMHMTKAREHFAQIISDILRPATTWINSHKIRTEMATLDSSRHWVANAAMEQFSATWTVVGDEQIYLDLSAPLAGNIRKLTPQMLQRRVHPLWALGYMGKKPFSDMPPLIKLLTDMETVWDLDKQASAGATATSGIQTQWRFMDWGPANRYWKYAVTGQLGNYATRADMFPLRFNRLSATRFQLVLPYKNVSATVGIGSTINEDFENAQYQITLIWHPRAMVARTLEPSPVNPQLPFSSRNFGGTWKWVMNNLGADANGCVIENKRGNKGQFIADFAMAFEPQYVELAEAILHKREPSCVYEIDTCNADPGYPSQDYNSENETCPQDYPTSDCLTFTPVADDSGHYVVTANTIACNGVPMVHVKVDATTLAGVAAGMPTILGTWSVVPGSTTEIQLCSTTCSELTIPWVV